MLKCLSFLFVGVCLSYLLVSVRKPIETRVFINQQHMHFVGTKEKVMKFQSTSATEVKELPILNWNKRITTACEQLSSTEGAPTVTISLVGGLFRSRTNLLYRPKERYSSNPISCPVLRTRLKRKRKSNQTKREQQKRVSTIEQYFYIQIGTGLEPTYPDFTPLSLEYQERRLALAISN